MLCKIKTQLLCSATSKKMKLNKREQETSLTLST